MSERWDETWHRLLEWTNGTARSERLAAQVLFHEGFESLDPSHPLGGKDGGKDATCKRGNLPWIMAVYFPRGQKEFETIKEKFLGDLAGVKRNNAAGIAFVTNQELRLGERKVLKTLAREVLVEIFHLERLTAILDNPVMSPVRKQFLSIDQDDEQLLKEEVASLKREFTDKQIHLEALQTGGETFCYWMLYHFDLEANIAQNFVVIRMGAYPLYDVRLRIRDMDAQEDVFAKNFGEVNSPADYLMVKWNLPTNVYYRVFFSARNGSWHQDLILRKSERTSCWLAATRVFGDTKNVRFEHFDRDFVAEFGNPTWRE
jgi:hypothetical protein